MKFILIILAVLLAIVPVFPYLAEVAASNGGQEVIELRTQTSKTHYLNDGIYATEAVLWPAHYRDTEGSWQEIDNAWLPATDPWHWQMTQDSYHAYAISPFTSGQILEFEMEGESVAFQPMELQWTNNLAQIQIISMPQNVLGGIYNEPVELLSDMEGSIGHIRWDNAYGDGRHFEWAANPGVLRTLLQLDAAPPDPLPYIIEGGSPVLRQSFIFAPSTGLDIYVNGTLWDKKVQVQTVNDIEVRQDGETVWYFWSARYWDSSDEGANVATTILRKAGNDLWLDVLVPYEWLQTALYPVFIDPDTGATLPGTGATQDRDGKVIWQNPANIQAEAGWTSCAVGASTYGDWLAAYNFGFAILDGATIDGIKVEINRFKGIGTPDSISDSSLRLIDNLGNVVGDDKASADIWPEGLGVTATYGGATDDWNASLTPAKINAAGGILFGIRLSAANSDASPRNAYVYWVKITVYYTIPPTVETDACSNVKSTSFDANGDITAGSATTRGFHYSKVFDNFEWGGDTDPLDDNGGAITWTISAVGTSRVEIDTAQHYSGTRSARLYRDGANNVLAYFSEPAVAASKVIGWKWRKDDTSYGYMVHGNGVKRVLLAWNTAEGIATPADGVIVTLAHSTWYTFTVSNVNWVAGTFDLRIDGILYSGLTMQVAATYNNLISFNNYAGTSEIWLDEVAVWDVEDEDGAFGTGEYSLGITGLDHSTTYYVQAFAENSAGFGYGNIVSQLTLTPTGYSWGTIIG